MNNTNKQYELNKVSNLFETNKSEYRDIVINWLAKQEIKYHLTVTYRKGVSQNRSRKEVDYFMHLLNTNIYRRSYAQGYRYIKGFAVRETTVERGEDHYRMMILDGEGIPDIDDMKAIVDKKLMHRKRSNHWDAIHNGKLQEYYNIEGSNGLQKYLTKNSLRASCSGQLMFDQIGFLGDYGTSFGRLEFDDPK